MPVQDTMSAELPDPRSEAVLGALYEEGISVHFLRVLMWQEDARRNSAEELVRKWLSGSGDPDRDSLLRMAGGFAAALAHGDMADAWYRADGNNTYILSSIYPEWEIDLYLDRDQPPSAFKHDEHLHPSWTEGA